MINDIIGGISKALDNEFNNATGNEYEIYAEDVSQGLKEPCFSIVHLLTTNAKRLPPRYLRSYNFDIHYFPKDKLNPKAECNSIAERLFLCLEYIFFLDNTVRGIKMSNEIIDGVLHFFVSYELFIKVEQEKVESMDQLNTKVGVKNG